MVLKKGDFEAVLPILTEAFGFDGKDAHTIHFKDDMAWITPRQQGKAEMTLTRGEDYDPPKGGPTIGPRFRKQHVVITVKDESGTLIFTNAKKKTTKKKPE